MDPELANRDEAVVASFGNEWERFDFQDFDLEKLQPTFEAYFRVFPWTDLPEGAVGADLGCGSGRWAWFVSQRCGDLTCVDASDRALSSAKKLLAGRNNVTLAQASIQHPPIEAGSLDFAYSLGVMHHMPDTQAAITAAAQLLKPGAPLLLYLYYAFDNRPGWYRRVWQVSELARATISSMPEKPRNLCSDMVAAGVYWPLARTAKTVEHLAPRVAQHIPLAAYRDQPFYIMRNDALDRLGTQLEQRFTRAQITRMMERAGLENVRFSDSEPFWCAVGTRTR